MTDNKDLALVIIVIAGILLLAILITGGVYYYQKLQIDNFQKTILNLSEEQKCLHICGFEFDSYLESYKFCAEKCDRISERLATAGVVTK